MLLTTTIIAKNVNAFVAANNAIAAIVELCVGSVRPVVSGMLSSVQSRTKQMRQREIDARKRCHLFSGGPDLRHCWLAGYLPSLPGSGSCFGFNRCLS